MIDYRKRAEECFERAARGGRTEDWAHFLEMAQTWEQLADSHELTKKLEKPLSFLPNSSQLRHVGRDRTRFAWSTRATAYFGEEGVRTE